MRVALVVDEFQLRLVQGVEALDVQRLALLRSGRPLILGLQILEQAGGMDLMVASSPMDRTWTWMSSRMEVSFSSELLLEFCFPKRVAVF